MANMETGPSADLDRQAVDRLEGILDDIDLALRRLEEGTYRTCMHCGEPIPDARLHADPTARSCARHPELSEQEATGGDPAGAP